MKRIRLQKIISEAGICSRRKAEDLIYQDRVEVNGQTAAIGDKADPEIDSIQINGRPIPAKTRSRVILLNKPKRIISSSKDELGRKTVLSFIPSHIRRGMHPVGRLDYYSRGAILITNDGELTLKLTHPKFNHPKIYYVWIEGKPSIKTINKWEQGIKLDGIATKKCKVDLVKSSNSKSLLKVILKEGKNRQIRRTSEMLGHRVIDLKRTSIASIKLGTLKEGSWREVMPNELLFLTNV